MQQLIGHALEGALDVLKLLARELGVLVLQARGLALDEIGRATVQGAHGWGDVAHALGRGIGRQLLVNDVAGLRVGNADDATLRSGTTVLTADAPFAAAVHVMGGAPGTRETDLLDPSNSVRHVDAVVLTGGSAFGLAAADGVMTWLEEQQRGVALTGAGGGGHMIFICEFEKRHLVADELITLGLSVSEFTFTKHGVTTWKGQQ